jgi:hypothetical protein
MGGRTLAFAAVLASAFGAPYAINKMTGSGEATPETGMDNLYSTGTGGPGGYGSASYASGTGANYGLGNSSSQEHLGEIIRFDVSPNWLATRWPSVSRVAAPIGLSGYRVTLVTGVDDHDLSGALTYYFDNKGRVQRIHLAGFTGNPARIQALAVDQYNLEPTGSGLGNVFKSSWNGQIISALEVTPAAVVRSTDQFARYKVELELNRASDNWFLSREFAARLGSTTPIDTGKSGSFFDGAVGNGGQSGGDILAPPQLRY